MCHTIANMHKRRTSAASADPSTSDTQHKKSNRHLLTQPCAVLESTVFLVFTIILYVAICFYTISTIVRQNYFDDAMDFAHDLAQRSCFEHEDRLRGLFDNIQLVESALMTDKHNIRCLVTPEAVVPVNERDRNLWLNNESYTTHSFFFDGAEVLVRVKTSI